MFALLIAFAQPCAAVSAGAANCRLFALVVRDACGPPEQPRVIGLRPT